MSLAGSLILGPLILGSKNRTCSIFWRSRIAAPSSNCVCHWTGPRITEPCAYTCTVLISAKCSCTIVASPLLGPEFLGATTLASYFACVTPSAIDSRINSPRTVDPRINGPRTVDSRTACVCHCLKPHGTVHGVQCVPCTLCSTVYTSGRGLFRVILIRRYEIIAVIH